MLMDRQDEHCEMAVLPKAVFRFSAVPTQTSMQFFTEVEKNNFIRKHKSLRTVKTILSIKRAVRGVPIPDFKLYYRAVLIKVV